MGHAPVSLKFVSEASLARLIARSHLEKCGLKRPVEQQGE